MRRTSPTEFTTQPVESRTGGEEEEEGERRNRRRRNRRRKRRRTGGGGGGVCMRSVVIGWLTQKGIAVILLLQLQNGPVKNALIFSFLLRSLMVC